MSNVSKLRTNDTKITSDMAAKESRIIKQLKKSAACALPINVQNTYESVLLSRNLQSVVYPVDNAVKQMGVDLLG